MRQDILFKFTRSLLLAGAMSLLVTQTAMAATDGLLDTDSEGTSDITITITEVVQITDVDDITVTYDHAGGAGINQGDAVCVYTNDPNSRYRVMATGDGGVGNDEFLIEDGSGNDIVYRVFWGQTSTVGDAAVELTSTVRNVTVFENATGTYPCGGNNASFRVLMTHNALMSEPAGVYSGTLTINLIPDDT